MTREELEALSALEKAAIAELASKSRVKWLEWSIRVLEAAPALIEQAQEALELHKKIGRATITIPWEAGYGPEYAPTAGDPEKSISDLLAVCKAREDALRQRAETAERHAKEQQQRSESLQDALLKALCRTDGRWRTGSKVPVNVYVDDKIAGQMQTPELAATVVFGMDRVEFLEAENKRLRAALNKARDLPLCRCEGCRARHLADGPANSQATLDSSDPSAKPCLSGAFLITAERSRQVSAEGWTPEHDDTEHPYGDLTQAAVSYAQNAICQIQRADYPRPISWPWKFAWWKPSAEPIRNLVKAGALIAAEIDRLQRRAANAQEPK